MYCTGCGVAAFMATPTCVCSASVPSCGKKRLEAKRTSVMEVKMLMWHRPMAVDPTNGGRVLLYDSGGTQHSEVKMPPIKERRKRSRLDLHWPVSLSKSGRTEPIRSKTENISSDGFYCLCREPFMAGEQLECRLSMPPHARREDASWLVLECKVRVARVNADRGMFGIGFQIESYSVMRLPSEVVY
jgi:PilZ domain